MQIFYEINPSNLVPHKRVTIVALPIISTDQVPPKDDHNTNQVLLTCSFEQEQGNSQSQSLVSVSIAIKLPV